MECAICYSEIKDHKLFKAGCCSIDICIDCFKNDNLKDCPQCRKSYGWLKQNHNEKIEELKRQIAIYKNEVETQNKYNDNLCKIICKYQQKLYPQNFSMHK